MEIDIDGTNLVSAKLFFHEPGDLLQLIKDHIEVYFTTDGRVAVDAGDSEYMIAFSLQDAAKWIAEDEWLTEDGRHLKLARALEECAQWVRQTGNATERRRTGKGGQ